MRVAVVGTGIAGNVAAYKLRARHDVTVFEASSRIGGHTHTVDVDLGGRRYGVDTGFIVYNDWTYPHFIALLDELGVATQPTSMSFSVACARSGLEYNGTSLDGLFAQRRNLANLRFHRMLLDILRFGRDAHAFLESTQECALGEFVAARRYGREFVERYLVPMTAAIWSAAPGEALLMPARFLLRFFANHGMLSVNDRPQWRTVVGGSNHYVEKLVAGHRERVRTSCAVTAISRGRHGVTVRTAAAEPERFDAVFLACHSDEALALLEDASLQEREVLGALRYRPNDVVLHTDAALLPRSRRAWASWNYYVPPEPRAAPIVTYHMNRLQNLDASVDFCVTLNDDGRIASKHVVARYVYDHPVFDAAAVAAQRRHDEIDGPLGTYFCGAYWRNGFHEDGVVSALRAVAHFEDRLANAELHLRRAG